MALEDLVTTAPVATHGYPLQVVASSGQWRWAVELADPTEGDYAEWYDLSQFYAGDRYQRGADEYLGKYRASVAQIQLQIDNVHAEDASLSSDILAPWGQDTTTLFGTDIELDAGLLVRFVVFRVVSAATVEWRAQWTGRVEGWGDEADARGQIRRHLLTVVDVMSDLVNVPTFDDDIVSWDIRIEDSVLVQAGWLYGVDIYGDTGSPDLPAQEAESVAITDLDAATDPVGCVWRTLRTGRMVVHPAPWDTTNTDRYDNPLLATYPDGIIFNRSPSFTELAYITDDDQQPFGVTRTSLGVVNNIVATWPGVSGDPEIYAVDDPVSIARYGTKTARLNWVIDHEAAVDDLLTARAYASIQALPIRTSIDQEGFWPAMSMVDHLDPITAIHQSHESGTIVRVTGTVRNITEERTFRREDGALSWNTTLQIDVTATDVTQALLPVENLHTSSVDWNLVVAEWTNPTQPSVTPTEVELRIVENSLIWIPTDYPGVGSDGVGLFNLEPSTSYTLQVRLVRRVDGVITHASPIRPVQFTTLAAPVPVVVPDDEDTDVVTPAPDPECELEVELQESEDGLTWSTIDTFTDSELTDNGDGTYSLTTPIDNSVFEADKVYRFRSREVCDGTPGEWFNGDPFDPPDDWTDPCVTPPSVSEAPFDDADCIVYVPQVCAPDIIKEYFSGIEATKVGFAGFVPGAAFDDPDQRGLRAISDPDWSDTPGGIIAYGECPQIAGVTGDKTIACQVYVTEAESCVLFACAAMSLECDPTSSGWRAILRVFKDGTTIILPSVDLDLDTVYDLAGTHDLATGDIKLYVNAVEDNSGGSDPAEPTINALPIWRVGAPPDSWITDAAVWSRVLAANELPGYGVVPSPTLHAAVLGLGPLSYWTLAGDDANTLHDYGTLAHDLTALTMTLDDEAGNDGFNYPDPLVLGAGALDSVNDTAYEPQTASGLTVMFMYKELDASTTIGPMVTKVSDGNQGSWSVSLQNSSGLVRANTFTAAGSARQAQHTTILSGVTDWVHIFVRFSGSATGFPTLRIDGTNITMSNSGTGSAQATSGNIVRLFCRDGTATTGHGSLAHVAIFAGELSDGDCATLEAAATTDGW